MLKRKNVPVAHISNKNKFLILAIILVILAGIYFNRAYSHIYGVLGAADLEPVGEVGVYNVNSMATSSLVYSALGDSLTAGVGVGDVHDILPYLLAEKLSGNDRAVILKNHSYPGVMTAGILVDFLPAAINDNPDIVTLLIGVNDIHNKVSAAEFRKNYGDIVRRLKQETKASVYLINLPFIGADSLMLPPYQALFDARTRKFNKIIKEVSAEYSVGYIDLYTPTVDLFKRSGTHYSKDLFHPSAEGYKLWADIIYDNINQ